MIKSRSSGIKLPDVHGIGKGLHANVQPENQVIKPTLDQKTKEVSQIKPRLGQGRAGLRCKTKIPIPINKPIGQAMEKQPKILVCKSPKVQDKVIPIPNCLIPQVKHRDDTGSRKTIKDVSREIPI